MNLGLVCPAGCGEVLHEIDWDEWSAHGLAGPDDPVRAALIAVEIEAAIQGHRCRRRVRWAVWRWRNRKLWRAS